MSGFPTEPKIGCYTTEVLQKVRDRFKLVKLTKPGSLTYGEKYLQQKWRNNSAHYNRTSFSSVSNPNLHCKDKLKQFNSFVEATNDKLHLCQEVSNKVKMSNTVDTWKTKRNIARKHHLVRRNSENEEKLAGDMTVKPLLSSKDYIVDKTWNISNMKSANLSLCRGVTFGRYLLAKKSTRPYRSKTAPLFRQSSKKKQENILLSSDNLIPTCKKYSCPSLRVISKELIPKPKTALPSLQRQREMFFTANKPLIYPGTPPTTRRQSRVLIDSNFKASNQELASDVATLKKSLSFNPKRLKDRNNIFGHYDVMIGDVLADMSDGAIKRPMTSDCLATSKVIRWLGDNHATFCE